MTGTDTNKISGYQTLKRLFRFVKPHRTLFYLAGVLAVLQAPLSALTPYLTNVMVDDYIMKSDLHGLKKVALLFLAVLLLTTIMRYAFMILTNLLGQNIILDMRKAVFAHLLHLRMSYFDQTPVGTNTTRTINDLETLNSVFSEGLITIIADILALISVLLVMLYTSVKLTIICLISFPFLLLASYLFKEKVKSSFQRVRQEVTKMNTFLQEHISGMKIVQIFNAQANTEKKFKEINREYTQANLDGIFYYAVFFPVVEIISAASLGLMVWWGAQGVLSGSVTVGQLVAFPMFLSRLFQPVRMLADKFNTLQMGLVAGERVLQIFDNPQRESKSTQFDRKESLHGDVVFSHVNFSYQNDKPVLKDISFTLPQGKNLAIIGKTGSGKTSIINLINRLYEKDSGEILINSTPIENYDLGHLRKRIGIVLQDVFLFNGTIYENLSMHDPEISLPKVEECAKKLGVHTFIEELPGAYNFQISERGVNLSVGQRQLLSFVRAMVFDPDILVLDEATSSIDNRTEATIQSAIEQLLANRTSITIAHRLSTIQNADLLLVLENGEIKEIGSIAELSQRKGSYLYHLERSRLN
ncbi:MAG: ABC transporter ATP-binding protein/permease [Saprospiraceae bacterium]|jgi:ATP-binding cassette subfamily B multidrug efflux pump|nr:ABC transporter ATP-binding protein/permease [Saprospiraceae bacterium]